MSNQTETSAELVVTCYTGYLSRVGVVPEENLAFMWDRVVEQFEFAMAEGMSRLELVGTLVNNFDGNIVGTH